MKQRSPTILLAEFINGIASASVGAWAMAHYFHNPRFLPIRDRLELIKSKAVGLAVNKKIIRKPLQKAKNVIH